MLLNINCVADWGTIRLSKQRYEDKDNERRNSLSLDHDYQIGDKVHEISNDIHLNQTVLLDDPTILYKYIVMV